MVYRGDDVRIRLDPQWIDYLTQKPETGMGYQKVEVTLTNGGVLVGAIVFNCEWLEHVSAAKCLSIGIRSIKVL